MNLSKSQWWERFQKYYTEFPTLGMAVDLSRMNVSDDFFAKMEPSIQKAFRDMDALEAGAISNPDEKRMVGHYWLRNTALAPTPEIKSEIEAAIKIIKQFSVNVHDGKITGSGGKFLNVLIIGIGGSALGPQFVANALSNPKTDKLKPFFFDNTDPDGMNRVLEIIGNNLNRTLCIVISKSGGTKETRNGMLIAEAAYAAAGLNFAQHAVAITMAGSDLDKHSKANEWIAQFPMWDWIGGRTSELSAVGLLPAALQGFDISDMLAGAAESDKISRTKSVKENPAAQLALAWYQAGDGKGLKNMVVLPYKDRLELFSKYLQQLVMESLGKEKDFSGNLVNQGITVLGNKGATDQHSYIQQLRDGLNDFFAIFIEVLEDESKSSVEVEPNVTTGDFLEGFYLGTRQALSGNNRESITITVKKVSPFYVGLLIALFERAVGFYANLININAYHQPGVEAGKKAAASIISLQEKILAFLNQNQGQQKTLNDIATAISATDEMESIFKLCEHLAANSFHKVKKFPASEAFAARYAIA